MTDKVYKFGDGALGRLFTIAGYRIGKRGFLKGLAVRIAPHTRHVWVKADNHQKRLWHCTRSLNCLGKVAVVCKLGCGASRCADHTPKRARHLLEGLK